MINPDQFEDISEWCREFLENHYFRDGIFIREAHFDLEHQRLVAVCRVNPNQQYTRQPIAKVTGPQYFIAVAQLATVLMGRLIVAGVMAYDGFTLEFYRQLMCDYELLSLELHFKRFNLPVKKGEDFILVMTVEEIRRTANRSAIIAKLNVLGALKMPAITFMAPLPRKND